MSRFGWGDVAVSGTIEKVNTRGVGSSYAGRSWYARRPKSMLGVASHPASQFAPPTSKIRNFRILAPFSTLFIFKRRWDRTLQLSFGSVG